MLVSNPILATAMYRVAITACLEPVTLELVINHWLPIKQKVSPRQGHRYTVSSSLSPDEERTGELALLRNMFTNTS